MPTTTISARTEEPHHLSTPCPPWCTLPADHRDTARTGGWSRTHEVFSARAPIDRGTFGDVRDAVVFIGQYECFDVGVGLSVQPPHFEVFDLDGDSVFGSQAVELAAALVEAGSALARITGGTAGAV